MLQSVGLQRVGRDLSTEQQQMANQKSLGKTALVESLILN